MSGQKPNLIQITELPYSCGLYGCTSHNVSDHTCTVSCVWQLMLHSEVALVAKHWWVDLIAILGCCIMKC